MGWLDIGGPNQRGDTSSNTDNHATSVTTANNFGSNSSGNASQSFNISGLGPNANITLSTGDYGAIQAGLTLGREALAGNAGLAQSVVARTLDIASKNQVSESAQLQDTILKIAMVLGVAVVLGGLMKRG